MNKKILPLVLILLTTLSACSKVISPSRNTSPSVKKLDLSSEVFSHEIFDQVLSNYVNNEGKVNYKALKNNSQQLDNYYSLVSRYSPDSHPQLFPAKDDELTYWINAYNVSVIKTVLNHYPIKSVKDVSPPRLFFFLPKLSGFFVFQKQVFGGEKINLYNLENKIIRKRYNEPRIHFAINCASLGCPRLPAEAFEVDRLDEQLERESKKFFSEKRNFSVDIDKKVITLSSIIKWFKSDFGDIRSYVSKYVDSEQKKYLLDQTFDIEYSEYDWNLNDWSN